MKKIEEKKEEEYYQMWIDFKPIYNTLESNFKKNKYETGFFLILLFWNSESPYIQIVYENFISGNHLICKLVHTSRDNK